MKLALLVACAAMASAATQGPKRFSIAVPDGRLEIDWITDSSFRVVRTWGSAVPRRHEFTGEAFDIEQTDLAGQVRFKTRHLIVDLQKSGAGLVVRTPRDRRLTSSEFKRAGAGAVVEHSVTAAERFYGLGSRPDPKLDLRGSVVRAVQPLLISSEGYGEYYAAAGEHTFDLTNPRRVTLPSSDIEYYFYYGPNPKDIAEAHLAGRERIPELTAEDLRFRSARRTGKSASWEDLRGEVARLAHASYGGILFADFELALFDSAAPVFARAAQLAALLPMVRTPLKVDPSVERRHTRLVPFFASYIREAMDRGFPIVRALSFQYPEDTAALARADQLMVGDELLVAPVLGPEPDLKVYLPKGIWTHLRTNQAYPGRQEIAIRADPGEVPVFARNGSIVPFASEGAGRPFELHYFPKLAAELFLWEQDRRDFSQFHAAPALDFMRLESESLITRECEWIVHNIERVKQVTLSGLVLAESAVLKPGTWRYDAPRRNLHVRLLAAAHGDEIVNIRF